MDQYSRTPPTEDEAEPGLKKRRAGRVVVDGKSSLRSQQWYSVEVKVRNVSTCGFMAECREPVGIGSYVSLEVPGVGPVHAQVRWQIGGTMGGMFLDPINLVQCEWTAVQAEGEPGAEPKV